MYDRTNLGYSYDYGYSTTVDPMAGTLFAGGALFLICLIVFAVVYVIDAVFMMMIFKKAGLATWKAWVPVYSTVKFFQIGGQNPLFLLFLLIPFVGVIVTAIFDIIAAYNIGLKLGKSGGWVVMYIFLPIVWLIVLAVDKSEWKDSLGVASLAPEKSPK